MLDVAGINYADARYALDRDLFPDRIIVGTETFPTSIDGNWGLVKAEPPRHRRLHLDRLGLPRRGRHRPTRYATLGARAGVLRRIPRADRMVRRHRHHRPPPARLVLPGDRLRPALRPVHRRAPPANHGRPIAARRRGRGATPSRAGPGPAPKARRSPSRSTATPTRSNCCSTATRLAGHAGEGLPGGVRDDYRPGS